MDAQPVKRFPNERLAISPYKKVNYLLLSKQINTFIIPKRVSSENEAKWRKIVAANDKELVG